MLNQKQYSRKDTDFLRFIAVLFVINSHLELYYPHPNMGTGGAIGISLFFVLSSFGLLLSERKIPRNFTDWYARRIKRIYPSIWAALIFIILPFNLYKNIFDIKDILNFLGNFFYPPSALWFLRAIMVYYLLNFIIIKNYHRKKLYFVVLPVSVLYVVFYLNFLDLSKWTVEDVLYFKLLFYTLVTTFGIFLADINHRVKYAGLRDWLLLFLSFGVIYGHKFMMFKDFLPSLQFVQQLFLLPLVYYAFKVSRSNFIQNKIMEWPVVSIVIKYISSIALEVYIVQGYISPFILELKLPFPVNIVVFVTFIFIFSSLIKFLSKRMYLAL